MTHPTPVPSPTPECAAFETLLPLLDTDALTPDETAATKNHIAGCAWCRFQRDGYDTFEAALRHHYSPGTPEPSSVFWPQFRLEDIMRADETEAIPADENTNDKSEDGILEITSIGPIPSQPHDPNRRPRSGRPRLYAEIAAVLVVALLATTLLVTRFGPSSGNQPPLQSAAGALVFAHSVEWGKLEINGQTVSITNNGANPLYLPRGRNALTYSAPPLPALTCTISAPAASDDTCPLYTPGAARSLEGATFSGRIIDLRALPNRLTKPQYDALAAVTQQALNTLTTVITLEPGDHVVTSEGNLLSVRQELKVTLSYHLADNAIGPSTDECMPYCMVSETYWSIAPDITWSYTDQSGQAVTIRQGWRGDTWIDTMVQWDGSWHVTLNPHTPSYTLCQIATSSLQTLLEPNVSWGYSCSTGSSPLLDGTILLPITFSKSDTGSPSEAANILYRAGLWIALDHNASYLFPSMPTASAHELAVARQLGYNS